MMMMMMIDAHISTFTVLCGVLSSGEISLAAMVL